MPAARTLVTALAAAAVAVGGCGGDESESASGLPFTDDGSVEDPVSLWGEYACAERSRLAAVADGGVDGGPYRRFTVIDGDDADGERCELGRNDHADGPTAVYRDGEHLVTRFAVRLPPDFPLDAESFQVVMQMKQSQPAANGDGTPALSLEAREGHWVLYRSASPGRSSESEELWSAPAEKDVWTRFEIDAVYSADAAEGSVEVRADLDGDGELEESSGPIEGATLKRETESGGDDGIAAGEPIPSHLRIGLYHDPEIQCPKPRGCSVEIGDVEIVEAE